MQRCLHSTPVYSISTLLTHYFFVLKTEMLRMHVTQGEFRSVNELHKEMAHAFCAI